MSDYISKYCTDKDGLFRENFMGDHYCGSDPNPVCIYRTNIRSIHDSDGKKQGCIYIKKDEEPKDENSVVVTLTEVLRRLRQQDF